MLGFLWFCVGQVPMCSWCIQRKVSRRQLTDEVRRVHSALIPSVEPLRAALRTQIHRSIVSAPGAPGLMQTWLHFSVGAVMMADPCQLDYVWNPLKPKQLGTPLRDFAYWIIRARNTHTFCLQPHIKGLGRNNLYFLPACSYSHCQVHPSCC